MNGQSRDAGHIGHKTQNEDKQNKTKHKNKTNVQHKKVKKNGQHGPHHKIAADLSNRRSP